ncbi:MAG: hypothetical protein H6Q04_1302 [Acidobacteria bacterium]|nr:hypothetical protein [Acidobacteriota bacterium]
MGNVQPGPNIREMVEDIQRGNMPNSWRDEINRVSASKNGMVVVLR